MTGETPDLELRLFESKCLPPECRRDLGTLFDANYRRADPTFLDRSLAVLRHVAVAYDRGRAVGFALAETRTLDLPRLPEQTVMLAGISCVDPAFRRRGMFSRLELLAARGSGIALSSRVLACGRMAHPAALRTLGRLAGVVPKAGRSPGTWAREVGAEIARLYRVHRFDPETFVCIGAGRPIGYPRIEFDVEPGEWEVFGPVDRDRGDALLALGWLPESPEGWE